MDINPVLATEQIIELFGGIRPMAAKLDMPVTTVQGWKKRGLIPQARHADIAAAAAKENIAIDAATLAATDPGGLGRGDSRSADEQGDDMIDPADASAPPASAAPVTASIAGAAYEHPGQPRSAAEPVRAAPVVRQRSGAGGTALALSLLTLLGVGAAGAAAWFYYLVPLDDRIAALEARPASESAAPPAASSAPASSDSASSDSASSESALRDLRARLDALGEQVQQETKITADLAARQNNAQPSPATDTTAQSDRIAALEKQIADLKASALESAQLVKKISDLQAAAGGRELLHQSIMDVQSSTAATQGQVERLASQLTALNGRVDKNEDAIAVRKQQSMRAEAVMLAIGELRASLRTSAPFATEITAVRSLAKDDPEITAALDQIQPYADAGVPSKDDLRADFSRLAPNIVRSAVVRDGSEWWRQALYHLESVISIRRTGAGAKGDSVDARVAQAEEKLDEDDLKGAIATLQPLDGLSAEVVQPWLHQAQERVDVDAADAELTRLSIDRVAGGNADATQPSAQAPTQPQDRK